MKKYLFARKFVSILLVVCMSMMTFSSCSEDEEGDITKDELELSELCSSNSESLKVTDLGSPDWLEIHNPTDHDIDLQGYMIYRADKKNDALKFGEKIIKAGEYLVVLCTENAGDEEGDYLLSGFRLPKEGTTIIFKRPDGQTIMQQTIPALGTDISYCKTGTDFKACLTPTPGFENGGLMFDNMGQIQGLEVPEGLEITEASKEFVEFHNASGRPIQLAYFTISDSKTRLSRFRLPAYELKADEYLAVYFSGETGEYVANFGISDYESEIYLSSFSGLYDQISVAGIQKNMSVGKNENGDLVFFSEVTPGRPNSPYYSTSMKITDKDSISVSINEMMLKNKNSLIDENGDRPDWVELYNGSGQTQNLSHFYLSDDEGNSLKWRLPDVEMEDGTYMVIYLSGNDSEYHTSFKVGSGETLYITDYRTLERQGVFFPDESRLDNVSYGLKDGKWVFFGRSTPGKENTSHGFEEISDVDKLDRTTLYISEVSSVSQARSGGTDWIEIHNPSDTSISLDGLYISDSSTNLTKYALSGSVSAGGYVTVNASSKPSKQGSNTAPFSISPAGETLYLSDGLGLYDVFETGVLKAGYSCGRADGDMSGKRVFFSTPTKGTKNAEPTGPVLNSPEFSRTGGIVDKAFSLELSGEGSIYYTTDGSVPTSSSSLYSGPIQISSNSVITAICMKSGRIASEPVTMTYLFEKPHTVPVVCLSTAPADFTSVNSATGTVKQGRPIIEKRCYIEYYEKDGSLGTAFPAGFRVSGNSTRVYAQKSYGIYLRSGYGQGEVVYPFFDDYPMTSFNTLVLRNGGQDWKTTRMRDAYCSNLFKGLDLDLAMTKLVVVYINGKYWGLYDLKESLNEDCLADQHGVEADNLNVMRRNLGVLAGSTTQVKEVYAMAKSLNTAVDSNYEKFCKYVDADAWIDYIIARAYTADYDMFNQKLWNEKNYEVKWRPIFYDCDFAFSSKAGSTLSKYFTGAGVASPDGSLTNMWIPTALKKNQGWCDKFLERASELMKTLSKDALTIYDSMIEEMRPEMERHCQRWSWSKSSWESDVKTYRDIVASRPATLVKQIKTVFGVSDTRMKELFPDY